MERCEEVYGIRLFIDDSHTARVRGRDIFIHPRYELSTKTVLNTMMMDWTSLCPRAKRLIEYSPVYKTRRIKEQLKCLIPDLITK